MLERLATMFAVFVGRMFDKFSNIRPTKYVAQTWVLNGLTMSDQQMFYNAVGT